MTVRTDGGTGDVDEDGPAHGASVLSFSGPLDQMLGSGPVFRSRLRGYDPMEVDAYVSWAESELRTVRREVDDLLARFGACSAELEISRRMLADAPRGRVVFPVSDRVEEMLQLAAEEAAAITAAGVREAEHVVAEARSEADARLRKAHQIKEMAVLAADELRDEARKQRAEAQARLDRAGAEAAALLRAAAQERETLAAEAVRQRDSLALAAAEERRRLDDEAARQREQAVAAAEARLAELGEEVSGLRAQRDEVRRSLRGLSSVIGEALQAVAETVPDAATGSNVALEGMDFDESSVAPAATDGPTGEAPSGQRGAGGGVLVDRRPAALSS